MKRKIIIAIAIICVETNLLLASERNSARDSRMNSRPGTALSTASRKTLADAAPEWNPLSVISKTNEPNLYTIAVKKDSNLATTLEDAAQKLRTLAIENSLPKGHELLNVKIYRQNVHNDDGSVDQHQTQIVKSIRRINASADFTPSPFPESQIIEIPENSVQIPQESTQPTTNTQIPTNQDALERPEEPVARGLYFMPSRTSSGKTPIPSKTIIGTHGIIGRKSSQGSLANYLDSSDRHVSSATPSRRSSKASRQAMAERGESKQASRANSTASHQSKTSQKSHLSI